MGVGQNAKDCTMNVMPTSNGKVLTALTDGGFHHLVASARSNVGIKAGRYFYEVRIVETRTFADVKSKAKPSCCLGFSTADASLFLSDEAAVGFDAEGYYVSAGEWSQKQLFKKFDAYTAVYGVLLNLDQSSPNANTVSLFCNGERFCKPQALPESMKGKALYPTVNYKGMTLHVNMGASCVAPLPFTCRMVQDAAADDVALPAKATAAKAEVVIPVGLPDEGTFEWLDAFLKENPKYTELSNRSLLKWALKSGHYQGRAQNWSYGCNDTPDMNFGIKELDEFALMKTIYSIAPMLKRDYVVMEVKGNLVADERRKALDCFPEDSFTKTAMVVVGEPPNEFKAKAHKQILDAKQKLVVSEVLRQKYMEVAQKRAEKEKREKEEETNNKENTEEGEKDKDEKAEEDVQEEQETIEDAIKKAQDAVELTSEEKSTWFAKSASEDLTQKDLAKSFPSFSLPGKGEGFDAVKHAWQKEAKAAEYVKAWISERKLTQRVEDLTPGDRFREQSSEWNHVVQEWRKRSNDHSLGQRRKKADFEERKKAEDEKKEVKGNL